MRAAIERWLVQRWYGGVQPGLGLRALAGLYRALKPDRASTTAQRLPVPVLVVGNFTAGGTGKTPLVIALARHLESRGFKPGIVSRGHGRRSGSPLRVSAQTAASECGDEPKLILESAGVPVFVDRDRVSAARAAVAAGCNIVIADDGLQHHRLARDVEIEVVDGSRGYGNGLLIPAGPLREAPRTCEFRVVNGGPADPFSGVIAGAGDIQMKLCLAAAKPVAENTGQIDAVPRRLAAFGGTPVHAVAGIGNPARFFDALRAAGLQVVEHPFGDHHRFHAADFTAIGRPLLMTEKDAVKCRGFGLDDAWAVAVEAVLPATFYSAIEDRIRDRHDAA